ncbi:hypothetical protein GCM10009555_027780 [Acrocarpospora macrocephala]|uniref:ESX-1 secretion-associated protein n=1 Tax=Acrocarpospora macrocephala TaxID=150177 RepID=A0A5M3X1G8_9ACTN|nr:hypothetical protein [Acrocarpospora macrocephala]GES15565.1 hypothetical protein Amac_091620 [Acrocarpospora macrocephala]
MDEVRRVLQQAAEVEALAVVFDRYAAQLAETFQRIPTARGESMRYWTGPAALRFADQSRVLDNGIGELVHACQTTARNLRRRAGQLRDSAIRVPS